ncbi:MAG TPA: hypothetical protein VFT72_04790 [Opitutaceae bacterium]|nr:hypothetical protein [Opitutaceae bacterium]
MNTRVWLSISTAFNLILVGVVWHVIESDNRESARRAALAQSQSATAAMKVAPNSVETPHARPLDWSESMAEFRRAGVPSEILAKVVIEKIARKWTPLEQQWEKQYLEGTLDANKLAELHDQRARDQEAELRSALGNDFVRWDRDTTVENMYLGGYQPKESEKEPLYTLQQDYLNRLRNLETLKRQSRIDESSFETDRAEVERDYKAKLAGIIGAERVDELAPAITPVEQVRQDFAKLQLTDAQIKALAAVNETWDSARSDMSKSLDNTKDMDVAYEGDLQALDRGRDEEYRRILGDEAFNAWQRAGDDRYIAMRRNAAAWQLDDSTIANVYSLVRGYELAVASYEYQAQVGQHEGKSVDWSTVESQIANDTRDTEKTLRRYLGDQRFERMQAQQVFGLRKPNEIQGNLNARLN